MRGADHRRPPRESSNPRPGPRRRAPRSMPIAALTLLPITSRTDSTGTAATQSGPDRFAGFDADLGGGGRFAIRQDVGRWLAQTRGDCPTGPTYDEPENGRGATHRLPAYQARPVTLLP